MKELRFLMLLSLVSYSFSMDESKFLSNDEVDEMISNLCVPMPKNNSHSDLNNKATQEQSILQMFSKTVSEKGKRRGLFDQSKVQRRASVLYGQGHDLDDSVFSCNSENENKNKVQKK